MRVGQDRGDRFDTEFVLALDVSIDVGDLKRLVLKGLVLNFKLDTKLGHLNGFNWVQLIGNLDSCGPYAE